MLKALVAKLKSDIDNRDQELGRQEHILQQLEEERKATSRRIETLEYKLTLCSTKITELIGEKEKTEDTLRLREFEFEMLSKSTEQKIDLRQQCINLREKEILNLKMHLQKVESELDETNMLIPTLEENLQKVLLELDKKSAEVRQLQENNNDLRLLLDMEKRVLDNYLLQQTAANTSHDTYVQEVHVSQNFISEQLLSLNARIIYVINVLFEKLFLPNRCSKIISRRHQK